MPMNARLLRPIASRSLTDADATAYLSAVQTADGQALEPAVRDAITAFVIGCKQDGIWSAIKASCILMGARTLSGALTPLVGTAPTNNGPFVSGDYNRKTGLVGNGTSKHLNSNRLNNADGLNDKHAAAWVTEYNNPLSTFACYMGAGSNGNGAINVAHGFLGANPGWLTRHHTASIGSPTGSPAPQIGLYGISRSASSSYVLRANGFNTTVNESSVNQSNDNVFVFARSNGAAAESFTNGRIAFYSIGSNLTLSLLDSRVTTLYNAIGAATL